MHLRVFIYAKGKSLDLQSQDHNVHIGLDYVIDADDSKSLVVNSH